MIWREKRVLLIVLGVILAINTIFFFTYRVQYRSRLDEMDQRLADAEKQLASARASRISAEGAVQSYRRTEADVQEVLNHYWSTQPERLTALISEVKRLALASNLVPSSYGFQRTETKDNSSTSRMGTMSGVTEVGISFAVQGTYEQARRLINLLELSRQFVIIDQITLTSTEGSQLTLNLHLKTMFRDETAAQKPL